MDIPARPSSATAECSHRLGSIKLFAGLSWTDLEHAAGCFSETLVERGTRMTVQGHPSSRLWLIVHDEALVSADAHPVRVAGRGDVVGGATMLYRLKSPESTIALTAISAFEAGPEQFRCWSVTGKSDGELLLSQYARRALSPGSAR